MIEHNDTELRDYVARVGNEAPPMPEFEELADLAPLAPQSRGRRPSRWPMHIAAAAVVVSGVVGLGVAAERRLNSTETVEAVQGSDGSGERSVPSIEDQMQPIWAGKWAMPTTFAPFEVLAAYEGETQRTILLIDPSRGHTIDVTVRESSDDSPDLPVLSTGESSFEQVSIGDINADLDRGDDATVLTWSSSDVGFSVSGTPGVTVGQLTSIATSLEPIDRAAVPVKIDRLGGAAQEPEVVVAVTEFDDTAVELRASTSSDGSLNLGTADDGFGGPFELSDGQLVEVAMLRDFNRDLLHGIVDPTVVELTLNTTDQQTINVPIQGAELGFGVGFFIVALDADSPGSTLMARTKDGQQVEIQLAIPARPNASDIPVVAALRTTVEDFVTQTLEWEVDSTTVVSSGDDAGSLIVSDAETGAAVRVTMSRTEPRFIEWVGPVRNWQSDRIVRVDEVVVTFDTGIDAASATVFIATASDEHMKELTAADLETQRVRVSVPGVVAEETVDILIIFRDDAGRVIGALSPAAGGA